MKVLFCSAEHQLMAPRCPWRSRLQVEVLPAGILSQVMYSQVGITANIYRAYLPLGTSSSFDLWQLDVPGALHILVRPQLCTFGH